MRLYTEFVYLSAVLLLSPKIIGHIKLLPSVLFFEFNLNKFAVNPNMCLSYSLRFCYSHIEKQIYRFMQDYRT